MSDLYNNRYRKPSARAQWHDYNGGYYFITICTDKRKHYFGEIKDNYMSTSLIGDHAILCIKKINDKYNDSGIDSFVVMPDHVHLIIFVQNTYQHKNDRPSENSIDVNERMSNIAKQRGRLSFVVSEYKRYITNYARKYNIIFAWQKRFHDRIIRNEKEYISIKNYIERNVSNWKG